VTVNVPNSWNRRGEIPEVALAQASQDDLDLLTEDLFYACSPEHVEIDVGFYPEADPDGLFRGVTIVDGNWETPVEQFETDDAGAMATWTQNAVARWTQHVVPGEEVDDPVAAGPAAQMDAFLADVLSSVTSGSLDPFSTTTDEDNASYGVYTNRAFATT